MGDKKFAFLAGIGYTGTLADKENAYYTDLIANGGDPDRPLSGQYVPDRILWGGSSATSSGVVYLSYFTSFTNQTVSAITGYTAGTAAGATPTVCRYGLYSVASNGDLTLLSASANDTALFASTNTAYRKTLAVAQTLSGGSRYAAGVIVVTAAATPVMVSTVTGSAAINGTTLAVAPRLSGVRTGQTDIPSSILGTDVAIYQTMRSFLLD